MYIFFLVMVGCYNLFMALESQDELVEEFIWCLCEQGCTKVHILVTSVFSKSGDLIKVTYWLLNGCEIITNELEFFSSTI